MRPIFVIYWMQDARYRMQMQDIRCRMVSAVSPGATGIWHHASRTEIKRINMSSAFVRENDEQWLQDVSPSLNALIAFLTRENNGIRVYEKQTLHDPKSAKEIHLMSNGLSYAKDDEGRWQVV